MVKNIINHCKHSNTFERINIFSLLLLISASLLLENTYAPHLSTRVLDFVMCQAIKNREKSLGYTVDRLRLQQVSEVTITDINFDDNKALISNQYKSCLKMWKFQLLRSRCT